MNYRVSKFANFREKAEFLLETKVSDSYGIKSLVQTLFATEIFDKISQKNWNLCTNMQFQCTARSKNDYSLILKCWYLVYRRPQRFRTGSRVEWCIGSSSERPINRNENIYVRVNTYFLL